MEGTGLKDPPDDEGSEEIPERRGREAISKRYESPEYATEF
jgi:hypothetical protein